MTTHGYTRTGRQRMESTARSDPEARTLHHCQAGVEDPYRFRDVGVSGGTGTNARNGGWCRPPLSCAGFVNIRAANVILVPFRKLPLSQ